MRRHILTLAAVMTCLSFVPASASAGPREWSDASGAFRLEAELVEFYEGAEIVALRGTDDALRYIPLSSLSEADQAYVAAQREAGVDEEEPVTVPQPVAQQPEVGALEPNEDPEADENPVIVINGEQELEVWRLVDGRQIGFTSWRFAEKTISFSRRSGKVYYGRQEFEDLPDWQQKLALKDLGERFNKELESIRDLSYNLARSTDQKVSYEATGVELILPDGTAFLVPFYELHHEDRAPIQEEWVAWAAEREREAAEEAEQARENYERREILQLAEREVRAQEEIARATAEREERERYYDSMRRDWDVHRRYYELGIPEWRVYMMERNVPFGRVPTMRVVYVFCRSGDYAVMVIQDQYPQYRVMRAESVVYDVYPW
jgi:hypothetical protein